LESYQLIVDHENDFDKNLNNKKQLWHFKVH